MSEEKNYVPKRRFKEFQNADAWEQRKLGDIGEFKNGMNFSKDAMGHGYPFVNLQDVFGKNVVENSNLGLALSTDAQRKEYSLEDGDILFIRSSVKLEGVGEAAIVPKTFANTTYSGFIIRFRPTEKMNSLFNAIVFSTKYVRTQILMGATSSANTNINQNTLQKIQIALPSIREQEQIGSFFSNLDKLITLHQRKLEKMKSMKAAYLTEMFPQEGESVPKRRFAGFTDDWERRKLEAGTSKIGDGLHGTPRYSESGNVFFVNGNNFVDGNIVYTEDTKCVTEQEQSPDDKALNGNTILMSINGTIGNLAFYRGEKVMLGKSAAYITVRDFDKKFLYSYLQTSVITNHFMNSLTGTTIKNLGLKTIRETQIFTPSIEEQEQIGMFFSNLNNLINLHQRKLDKLQNIKKAYLNEMFI